ncbi:MAG: Gfo/Idh/MocA family oxidoreductase [bacterium]
MIGYGKWGINHVKTASSLLGPENIIACDPDPKSRDLVKAVNPAIQFTTRYEDILENPSFNAVVIATPAETHFWIAEKCLEHRKHVLIEKPITLYSSEARHLVDLAAKYKLKLMVGHVLLHHPAILKIKSMMEVGMIGKLQYIYSNRLNLGTIRSEENILWSFAPHDISIIQFLTGNSPLTTDAHGGDFIQDDIEDTTITYLTYPNNVHAHIFVSWLHPFKEHRLVVIGEEGMVVFEDSVKADKLKFYKKGFKKINGFLEKFDEDFQVISFGDTPALTAEHRHFYESVLNNTQPRTDGEHAFEVLQILECAQEGLKKHVTE